MPLTMLSVVIPALDEADHLLPTLRSLAPMRSRGVEVILADGGSTDGTPKLAEPLVDRVIRCHPGRAIQMNTGVTWGRSEVLWFLHADTLVPEDADRLVEGALAGGADWGWFDIELSGRGLMFRAIERFMNLRARLTRVATGDQGLFVRRSVFRVIGGFPDIALMEDVEICKRLRNCWRSKPIGVPIVTSSRRWERDGLIPTIALMWCLRLAFWLGADPARLVRLYYRGACRQNR